MFVQMYNYNTQFELFNLSPFQISDGMFNKMMPIIKVLQDILMQKDTICILKIKYQKSKIHKIPFWIRMAYRRERKNGFLSFKNVVQILATVMQIHANCVLNICKKKN